MALINCDMGESFGLYKMGDDDAIMPLEVVKEIARTSIEASFADPDRKRALMADLEAA